MSTPTKAPPGPGPHARNPGAPGAPAPAAEQSAADVTAVMKVPSPWQMRATGFLVALGAPLIAFFTEVDFLESYSKALKTIN